MDTDNGSAVSDAPGNDGGGAENPLVWALFAGNLTDEAFSAGSDKQGMAELCKGGRVAQQLQIVSGGFAEANAGVQEDSARVDARKNGLVPSVEKKRRDLGGDVPITGGKLHGLGVALHVHEHDGQTAAGDEGKHFAIVPPGGNVIDDVSAPIHGLLANQGVSCVDRDNDFETPADGGDGRNGPANLFLRRDAQCSWSGGLTAYIEPIRTGIDKLLGIVGSLLWPGQSAPIAEAIRGQVDDPHHQRRA
jgi:hypothetical protein